MSAVVIPWHPRDPLKLLLQTIHTLLEYKHDIIVVTPQLTHKLSFLPRVVQLKEKMPNVGGARATGIEYAYKQGHDCIITSDSHNAFTRDPEVLCRYPTFASAPHEPLPYVKIYSSYVTFHENSLMWCTVFENTETIPMTNEPLIAFRRGFIEEIMPYLFEYTSYTLDFVWALYSDKYGYIHDEVIFTHKNPLKPVRRPDPKEVVKLYNDWDKIRQKLSEYQPPRRLCAPISALPKAQQTQRL